MVEYKPGRMHLQTDHLSRLTEQARLNPMDNRLVNDNLFMVTAKSEWYANIMEFLITQKLSDE